MRNGKFVIAGDQVGIIFDMRHANGIAVHFLDENGETSGEKYFSSGDLYVLEPNDPRIPESRRG